MEPKQHIELTVSWRSYLKIGLDPHITCCGRSSPLCDLIVSSQEFCSSSHCWLWLICIFPMLDSFLLVSALSSLLSLLDLTPPEVMTTLAMVYGHHKERLVRISHSKLFTYVFQACIGPFQQLFHFVMSLQSDLCTGSVLSLILCSLPTLASVPLAYYKIYVDSWLFWATTISHLNFVTASPGYSEYSTQNIILLKQKQITSLLRTLRLFSSHCKISGLPVKGL